MASQAERLASIIATAEGLTFDDARFLSHLYDDEPGSAAGQGRKHADAALKAAGLDGFRVNWMRTAGSAVIQAQTREDFDETHDEPWRWATQTVLDAVRAEIAEPYLSADEAAALAEPLRTLQDSKR